MKKPRNPVARSPLLRKGGAHRTASSRSRQQTRDLLTMALAEWYDAPPSCVRHSNDPSRSTGSVSA